MYVDELPLQDISVGYGAPGLGGSLGYENKSVTVRGEACPRALSTHAPARVSIPLDGRFRTFRCRIALNDDVPRERSHANFVVRADGEQVGFAPYVVAGDAPVTIEADVSGRRTLELLVTTTRWEFCHAVWMDAQLDEGLLPARETWLDDCLGRLAFQLPAIPPKGERCIATVVTPGFEWMLAGMLDSLAVYGGCPDALKVIFAVEPNRTVLDAAARHDAVLIPCRRRSHVNATVKAVLYSIRHAVDARQFVCLDADILVLGSLRPMFDAIAACTPGSILVCRESNHPAAVTLRVAVSSVYRGHPDDIAMIGGGPGELDYPLVVNDGVFAAGADALISLDGLIRRWPHARRWVDERADVWWRNQFVFNLALARLKCGIEMDSLFNVQLHSQQVSMQRSNGHVEALWRGQPAHVVHFCGEGKQKFAEYHGLFAAAHRRP